MRTADSLTRPKLVKIFFALWLLSISVCLFDWGFSYFYCIWCAMDNGYPSHSQYVLRAERGIICVLVALPLRAALRNDKVSRRLKMEWIYLGHDGPVPDYFRLPTSKRWSNGFGFAFRSENIMGSPTLGWAVTTSVPYWFVVFLLLIPAPLVLRASIRRRTRAARGLCPHCGYDLRASLDRCPECGEARKTVGGVG